MKKILVVFTGGTIGSRIHNSTIDVNDQAGYYLLKKLQDNYHYDVEFETMQPLNILSENSNPDCWRILYSAMKKVDMSSFDGIIVTHGTDTLPYTSAVLGFLFCHTRIPVLITGSNYALENEKSNGLANFKSCVDFIVNSAVPGVFAIFQDNNGRNLVYLATRIMEADAYNDQYLNFGGAVYGEIKDGKFEPVIDRINPSLHRLSEPKIKLPEGDITFNNEIFAIRPYPGLNYSYYNFAGKPKAILHSLYHSGTGSTCDLEFSLPKFVKKCRDAGIDFYLISFKDLNSELYRTSREILEYDAVPLRNISFEAAYAKLCIAYNQNGLTPREYMEKEQYFEFLP